MAEQLVIVGSGPAGLTAAIYAARANLHPLVLEGMMPGGQLTQTPEIENFPGFENPVPGGTLVETMRKQAERLGVRFLADEVLSCDFSVTPKKLTLMLGGGTLESETVILATGSSPRWLGLPSERRLKGRGVSSCATCDGAFFKGKRVAVIGGGDTALTDALHLATMASAVTVIHRRDAFRASAVLADRVTRTAGIEVVWDSVPEEFLGEKRVEGIRIRNVKTGEVRDLPLEGIFVAIGHTPNTSAFQGQVEIDADGYLVTDRTRTSVPGVFAAGDVQDRVYKQAVVAAGTGCMAALEAQAYLQHL